MSGETAQQQQRPDLGIEMGNPAAAITVTDEQFPWLSDVKVDVSTMEVRLVDTGDTIRYGSIVDGNNTVKRMADDVPSELSVLAERSMFKGLTMLLQGQRTTSVEFVPYIGVSVPVYKTTNKGSDAPRLFFSIISDELGSPVVLKLGIAPHKKQQRLVGVLSGDSTKRRKKDGGGR